ncbi:DivIVA domain-containing protein [bacterium]|nr:DivIVA domain-containing protein [bacterium]
MKITPLDIRKQEFSKQLRGYDVDEVQSFLEMVADEYEAAQTSKGQLAKKVEFLEAKLKEYQQMESNLQDAMMNAQKAGRSAEEESGKRSELIIQNSQLEADRILQDARRKHQNLMDDISRLEGQRRSFILKMKQILRGQVELLEILEEEEVPKAAPEPPMPAPQAVDHSSDEN